MENWRNILKYEWYQKHWKDRGFDYQTTREWKEALGENFKAEDFAFCVWLRDEKNFTPQVVKQQGNAENLKKEYTKLWDDINIENSKNQQNWEEKGLTYQEAQKWIQAGFKSDEYRQVELWKKRDIDSQQAQEWISVGFKSDNYYSVESWRDHNFTPQEARSWIDIGINELNNAKFAAYLRSKGYQPSQVDWEQIKKGGVPAQEYLDWFYSKDQRAKEKELRISEKNLKGSLDLSGFINSEKIVCANNQLTQLDLTNCNQLKTLDCNNNYLQELKLPSYIEQLTELDIRSNNFPEQGLSMFSDLVNLEKLWIGNNVWRREKVSQGIYNRFNGGLEPLYDLTKLKNLDISNTDIDRGLEYLSENIKKFNCSVDIRKNAKVKSIKNQLAPHNNNFKDWKLAQKEKQIQHLQNQQFLLFLKQEAKINYLEARIQELIKLVKQQKEKIINAFLRLFPEKELLQELIKIHLEFIKASKQGLPSTKLRRQRDKIHYELEEKIDNEELAEKIQSILNDCEELVTWEIELEAKLHDKSLLIENQKQALKQVAYGDEEKESIIKHEKISQEQNKELQKLKLEVAEMKGQLTALTNKPIQQTINVQQGNALIGNTIGNQVDLSHNKYTIRIEEAEEIEIFEAKIQQTDLPYGIPASSKNN